MTLLLNIGNTHTTIASNECPPRVLERLETARLIAAPEQIHALATDPARPLFAACVVPAALQALQRAWPTRELRTVNAAGAAADLDFSLVDPTTLGADRIANAVAALTLHAPPVIVLDCGTALSIAVVDAARHFRGGAILPGRRLLRQALHQNTGQLPDVPLAADVPRALGTCTADAIRAGTDLAILGAVKEILHGIRCELRTPTCLVLATGGDAPYFLRALPTWLTPAPERFTLLGIARLAAQSSG